MSVADIIMWIGISSLIFFTLAIVIKWRKVLQNVMDILMWIIIGSLVVLIIMNPSGFSQDVTAVGGGVQGESKLLTGSGYVKAK